MGLLSFSCKTVLTVCRCVILSISTLPHTVGVEGTLNVTDFSTMPMTITFPADELADDPTEQIAVNIALVDDMIDEADREYFVLYLSLTNGASSLGLTLGTTVSVGGIDDNDGI